MLYENICSYETKIKSYTVNYGLISTSYVVFKIHLKTAHNFDEIWFDKELRNLIPLKYAMNYKMGSETVWSFGSSHPQMMPVGRGTFCCPTLGRHPGHPALRPQKKK